ncbi:MAG TPA: 7TM diverse intracellular signaling domain-containing protein [Holophagaceae bacterium]|nr:7TM diverse intracellular signaling domain-containing protein [Holophagaceae bacterium]
MHPFFWPMLDALQGGALLVLTLMYGVDYLDRRDRAMGWLALCCALIGLRHLVVGMGDVDLLALDAATRLQSVLVSAGFLALLASMARIFPRQLPRRLALIGLVVMLPNFVRNAAMTPGTPLDELFHDIANLGYLVGVLSFVWAGYRARREGDPMGRRLFLGLVGVSVPVLVEVGALLLFQARLRLSGFSLIALAVSIGSSWQWLTDQGLREAVRSAQAETEAWRGLIPHPTWREGEVSEYMSRTFGPSWAGRLEDRMQALDGGLHRLHEARLADGARLGWVEPWEETQPGTGFLIGWTVALAMEDEIEGHELSRWLRAWGAEVQNWGTVPPREGPYPSILLWGREPSILAVWREGDHARRLPRWVQVGGPVTEGPHARLERPLRQERLKELLQGMLTLG